eukprot:697552_1
MDSEEVATVTCSVNSNWSVIITYIYSSAMLVTLICASIKFIFDVNAEDTGCCKKFKAWLMSLWEKKKLYFIVLAHFFDTATDLAVVAYYYELYIEKRNKVSSGDTAFCNAVNPYFLFIASIFILIEYRVVSSVTIYISIKNAWLSFLQFVDLAIFKAVYVNYKLNSDKPNTAQSWICGMEAMFESAPQMLIQIGFIWKVSHQSDSVIPAQLIVSLILSFYSVTSKMLENDRKLFTDKRYRTHDHNLTQFAKGKGSIHWRYCSIIMAFNRFITQYFHVFDRMDRVKYILFCRLYRYLHGVVIMCCV